MRFGIAIAALAAGLALTGCTGGDEAPGGERIASPAATASGALTVWLMDGSQPESVVDAAKAQFAQAYPNVDVKVELQQWSGVQDKLRAALGADTTPDVVEIANTLTARYADAGLLADLTDLAADFGVADMLPGPRPSGELGGRRFGIPYYGGVQIVVYSKSDFEKADVSVPTSLVELETVASKLQAENADNKEYSAFYFPGRNWYGAVPFVWAHGGEIATQAGDGTWTGTLDSPEARKGLTQLAGLVERYSTAPEDADGSDNLDAFRTGDVGMMIDSWWTPGVLDAGDMQGDIGAFVLPGVEGDAPAPVFFGGSDLAIPAKSPNKGLAVEWTKILTGLEAQTQLARENGVIPNQEGAFAGHADNKFLQVADEAATNSRFTPVSPHWAGVESAGVLPEMLVAIFTEAAPVDEATTQASAQLSTILNGS